MSETCGNFQFIDKAKLNNYRLAFTRKTKNMSGAADILEFPNAIVWGCLYEVDDSCLSKLDKKEGLGFAYTRINVNITLPDGTSQDAITYTVIDKSETEIAPSKEYISKVIKGSHDCNLDTDYIKFLESIAHESESSFRTGFTATPTRQRKEAKGMPLVRISTFHKKVIPSNQFCVVIYQGKMCPAKVAYDNNLMKNVCQLDQSIRHNLDINYYDLEFGITVQLTSLSSKIPLFGLISPRTLILPIHKQSVLDMEKQICILHERNCRLLGVEEGDYLKIQVAAKNKKKNLRLHTITRRVFSGTSTVFGDKEYPSPNEFYLDLDGRLELGLDKEIGTPALISVNIGKLFASRILYYGVTLFLSFLALMPILEEFSRFLAISNFWAIILSLVVAFLLTILITFFDLRKKIQY